MIEPCHLQPDWVGIISRGPNMSTAQVTNSSLDGLPEHPEMLRGKLRRNRKYGRQEFERFDHLASSHASLGSATIGKVFIDCRFLFTKSKWGVMGGQSNQAGIIYLDLTFHEPKGCRLHSATVTVSLDDEHRDLHSIQGGLSPAVLRRHPVQMTDCYGPKSFMGPEKSVYKKESIHFNPNIQAAGFGASLAEVRKERMSTSSSRWRFSGQLLSSGSSAWKYDALQWELSENDFEKQSTRNNVVHTAFAFHHGSRPFFMKVDVEGKLRGLHGQLRNKFKNFLTSTKKDGGALTLINFGDQHIFTKPLDSRARNLHFEMEQANLCSIPMELPDPQQVEFRNILPNMQSSITPTNSTTMSPSWNWPRALAGGSSAISQVEKRSQLPVLNVPLSKEEDVMREQATAPTPTNLARIINSSLRLPEKLQRPDQIQQFYTERRIPIGIETMKAPSEDDAVDEKMRMNKLKVPEDPHNPVPRVSYLPGLLAILKLVVFLRNLFSWAAAALYDVTSAERIALGHETVRREAQAGLGDSVSAVPPKTHGQLDRGAGAGDPYDTSVVTVAD
ncbi:hypothetical protein F5B21DRAFT_486612 [Xylaria acuta]|nr:hypothetical protein F5B21DRAFT_486612 [Xylaria acuta]